MSDLRGHNHGKVTHGLTGIPEHDIWSKIKMRCLNNSVPEYKYYGGRDIKVCERWINSFINFYNDMGPRPSKEYSIERINVNGNYEPSNCRWATKEEQANNKTSSIIITYNGKTQNLKQWSKELNFNYKLVFGRIRYRNWDFEKAITYKKELPSHCRKGHEFSGNNLVYKKILDKQYRVCRACRIEQGRRAKKRKKKCI